MSTTATLDPRDVAIAAPTFSERLKADPGYQAFLLLRFVLGLISGTLVLAVLGAALEALLAPLLTRILPAGDTHGIDLGFWLVDTFPESLLLVPVGAVLLVAAFGLLHGVARMWRRLAVAMLGEGDEDV